MTSNFVQRELRQIFQTVLLPWAKGGTLRTIFADPGWQSAGSHKVAVRKKAGPALTGTASGEAEWPELKLIANNYPCLICVLDGEADVCVGSLRPGDGEEDAPAARRHDVYIYPLQRGNCLVVPAGSALPSEPTPHWERPHVEKASSHLLWIMLQPSGALVYTCRSAGPAHAHGPALFTKDARLSLLGQLFIETVQASPLASEVISAYLLTLLLCINEKWSGSQVVERSATSLSVAAELGPEGPKAKDEIRSATLERVCRYIQAHMIDELSQAQIARENYVSASQLKRLFREHLDTSVMKYVTQCRLEEAKALLAGTSFTIQKIGEICGYPNRAHFTKAFTQWAGVSPRAFRHGAQPGDEKYAVRFLSAPEGEMNRISS